MTNAPADSPLLRRLALFIVRRRRLVIGVWLALTIVGVVASGQLSSRWYQSSAVPGGPAYEGGQRALAAFGTGARAPDVVVFHTAGDAARSRAIPAAMRRAAAAVPGARTSSYFSTGNEMYLSRDRHTTFQVVYRSRERYIGSRVEKYELVRAAAAVPGAARRMAAGMARLRAASPAVWKTTTSGARAPVPNAASARWPPS